MQPISRLPLKILASRTRLSVEDGCVSRRRCFSLLLSAFLLLCRAQKAFRAFVFICNQRRRRLSIWPESKAAAAAAEGRARRAGDFSAILSRDFSPSSSLPTASCNVVSSALPSKRHTDRASAKEACCVETKITRATATNQRASNPALSAVRIVRRRRPRDLRTA